jgi:hypothetical protein
MWLVGILLAIGIRCLILKNTQSHAEISFSFRKPHPFSFRRDGRGWNELQKMYANCIQIKKGLQSSPSETLVIPAHIESPFILEK